LLKIEHYQCRCFESCETETRSKALIGKTAYFELCEAGQIEVTSHRIGQYADLVALLEHLNSNESAFRFVVGDDDRYVVLPAMLIGEGNELPASRLGT
jgi:hypothetical protein